MIKQRFFRGVSWRAMADVGGYALQILFVAIVARYLSPEEFGLVTIALLLNRLMKTFAGLSVGYTIFQERDATESQISAVFLIQLAIYTACAFVGALLAPFFAQFFDAPEAIPLIRVIVAVVVIDALGFPAVLMNQKLKFGATSATLFLAQLVGTFAGIAGALMGWGVWSLVVKLLVERSCNVVMLWWIAGWLPSKPDFRGAIPLVTFGLNLLGARLCAFFSQNAAHFILGRFIDIATLGAFNIAYNLAILPAAKIQSTLVSVLVPSLCSTELSTTAIARQYRVSVCVLCLVFAPVMLGLASIATPLVQLLYGEKFLAVATMLPFLAIAGFFRGTSHLMRGFMIAGKADKAILRISAFEAAVSIPGLLAGVYFFGVEGAMIVYVAVAGISFLLFAYAVEQITGERAMTRRVCWRSLLSAAVMMFAVWLLQPTIESQWASLVVLIPFGAVVYVGLRLWMLTEMERSCLASIPGVSHLFARQASG